MLDGQLGVSPSGALPNASAVHPNGGQGADDFIDGLNPYLVHSELTDEKEINGGEIAEEADKVRLPPLAQAFYLFDSGLGDGLTQAVVIKSIHIKYGDLPVVAVSKEFNAKDVVIGFKNLAQVLVAHPKTVLIATNGTYKEAPGLKSTLAGAAQSFVWWELKLKGNSEEEFVAQIEAERSKIEKHWELKPNSSVRDHTAVLVVYREDEQLESVVLKKGDEIEDYNFITFNQAFRLGRPLKDKAEKSLAPGLAKLAPGGVAVIIQAADSEYGQQIRQHIWPEYDPIKDGPDDLIQGTKDALTAHGKADEYSFSVGPDIGYSLRQQHVNAQGEFDETAMTVVYERIVYHYQVGAKSAAAAVENGLYQKPIREALEANNGQISLANSRVVVSRAPNWGL